MKKNLVRVISVLLLSAMMLSAVACGGTGNGETSTTTTASGAQQTSGSDTAVTDPVETQDPNTVPNIADEKYTGRTFLLADDIEGQTKYTSDSVFNHEISGDVYEDAVYTRTVQIEELFDIKLETVKVSSSAFATTVLSGTDEYALHTATLSNMQSIVNKKCVYNLYDIPELQLEKLWWDQNAQEKCSFDGKLYYTFSDFVITGVDNSRATYFNKTLYEQLTFEEDIYQLVREGKWTIDKMAEMAKKAVSDINGDGKITNDDQLGIVGGNVTFYEAMLTSCDAELVKMGDDGLPYFFWLDETDAFVEVYQGLLDRFYNKDYFLKESTEWDTFKKDRTLFATAVLAYAVKLRAEDIEFGILPVAKWDEAQENYLNVSPNGHALMIPVTVQDTEFVGNVLEALSYYSSKYYSEDAAMPAYFEKALTYKSTRDDESAESLQIIHDNISYVIKIVQSSFDPYAQFDRGNMGIASTIKSVSNVQKKLLDKAIKELGAGE